jgi:hypothetical protein
VFIRRSCLAQEYGRLRASAVAVSPAGAVPSMIVVMMRGVAASPPRRPLWTRAGRRNSCKRARGAVLRTRRGVYYFFHMTSEGDLR